MFCGFDSTDRRHALFETVSAATFKEQAGALQQQNVVYAAKEFDQKAVDAWPTDGTPPQDLLECCVQLSSEDPMHPDEEEAAVTMGPAQMTNTLTEGQAAYVPTWVSAFSNDDESGEIVPAQWAMLGEKLQEATDLGDTIRNNEFSAKVANGTFIEDTVHRQLLIEACAAAKDTMRKLPESTKSLQFEKLCAKVVHLQNTPEPPEKEPVPSNAGTTGGRLIVPTGKKPLSFFEWQYWTKFDPVRWWYADCSWGHPGRPTPYDIPWFVDMCMRKEELEYSMHHEIESQNLYKAPPVNRWRNDHKSLHMFRTVWSMDAKIKRAYMNANRPGNRNTMRAVSKLTPETLAECYATASEHKTLGALMRDESIPRNLRQALDAMQVATADAIDTDGHRRLLRHEGNAFSTRYGAMAVFTTPNFPQQRHVTMLLTRSDINNADRMVSVEAPELPLLGDMFKLMAEDPVGVAMADDLVFRLFCLHVIGVRRDCVSFRRNKKPMKLSEQTWIGSAAAATRIGFAGLPRAAVGPLESSGRWALHGHWRIFLHQLAYKRLLELFDKDPATLKQNLREYFTSLLSSVLSTMQASVAQLPRLFEDEQSTLPVLPLLRSQGEWFNGKNYTWKSGLTEEDDMTSSMKRPDLPQVEEYPRDVYVPEQRQSDKGFKENITGTAIARLPNYRRCGVLFAKGEEQDGICRASIMGLDGTLWRREFTKDVWELARQAILHMCGPSCWKYNKVKSKYGEKVARTCRHECNHLVQVPEQVDNPKAKKRLAEGKKLRTTVTISEEAETNMKGRVLPIQTQPFEGRTQYYGLACLRCNWDVQDVRCILPGLLTDILPSIGPQPNWSWMNTDTPARMLTVLEQNWDALLLNLAQSPRPTQQTKECLDQMKECELLLLETFVATHHTGYYVNSYTTKPGALLGEFMKHLRTGLERLHSQFKAEDEQAKQLAAETGTKKKPMAVSRRAARVLLRLNTAYTRCVHKGGPELVFPMLFGHMCYQTHRCWNVWTKTAVWRAMTAWRRSCNAMTTNSSSTETMRGAARPQPDQMAYAHRGLLSLLPKGWRSHEGGVLSPNDEWFDSPQEAYKSYLVTHQCEKALTEEELRNLVNLAQQNFNQVAQGDLLEVDGAVVTANQLDDYIHRGDHPVMLHMSLYVYSCWVFRILKDEKTDESQLRFPFRPEYKLASGFVQQIAVTERIPKLDGFTMPPPRHRSQNATADMEINNMYKSVVLRPMEWYQKALDEAPDPVSQYYMLHQCPEDPDPNHPWTLETAFSSNWHAHLRKITAQLGMHNDQYVNLINKSKCQYNKQADP